MNSQKLLKCNKETHIPYTRLHLGSPRGGGLVGFVVAKTHTYMGTCVFINDYTFVYMHCDLQSKFALITTFTDFLNIRNVCVRAVPVSLEFGSILMCFPDGVASLLCPVVFHLGRFYK